MPKLKKIDRDGLKRIKTRKTTLWYYSQTEDGKITRNENFGQMNLDTSNHEYNRGFAVTCEAALFRLCHSGFGGMFRTLILMHFGETALSAANFRHYRKWTYAMLRRKKTPPKWHKQPEDTRNTTSAKRKNRKTERSYRIHIALESCNGAS